MRWGKERRSYSMRLCYLALIFGIVCYVSGLAVSHAVINEAAAEPSVLLSKNQDAMSDYLSSQKKTETGVSSLEEHSEAIMDFQWWIISGFFTLSQLLIGFIYITGQKSTRIGITDLKATHEKGMDELKGSIKELYDKKLDKEVHRELCFILKKVDDNKIENTERRRKSDLSQGRG